MAARYPETVPPHTPTGILFDQLLNHEMPLPHDQIKGVFEVPGTANPHLLPVFRLRLCADTPDNQLVTTIHKDLVTAYDYHQVAFNLYGTNALFVHKETPSLPQYVEVLYQEAQQHATDLGSGIVGLIRKYGYALHNARHANPDDDLVLTIFCPNTYHWFVTDIACLQYLITNTTLYDTLGPELSLYILNVTKLPVLFVSSEKVAPMLLLVESLLLLFVRALVVMDKAVPPTPADEKLAEHLNVELFLFEEVVALGKTSPLAHIPPTPDTVYTILFTLGTLGNPKGVELTHEAAVAGLTLIFGCITKPQIKRCGAPRMQLLCILPLAHVYQRLILLFEICVGITIYLPSDPKNIKQVLADLKVVKPTHMIGVPRIFNRIDAGLRAKVADMNFIMRTLVDWCVQYKDKMYKQGVPLTNHWFYDRILTKKIKLAVGLDNLQLVVSGSAPILPDTIKYLRALLDTEFIQGYGLTELFACVLISLCEDEVEADLCGYITISTEVKLMLIPEMEYTWEGNRLGELWFRGPQIFDQYYRDPVKTAEALDADGWFHSGDVGTMDADGRIRIVDRVKNFFKLAQGEYILPEKIENVYVQFNLSLLSQVYVHGDLLQTYLVAVVVVLEPGVLAWLKEAYPNDASLQLAYMNDSNMEEVNHNTPLRKALLKELNANATLSKMINGLERLKNIHLFFNNDAHGVNVGFTEQNGLMTPTLKIKRHPASKFFASAVKDMYAEGPLA